MSITSSVRALLEIRGKRQVDLLPVFGLANPQSLSNKFRGERWSASDLVKVAEFTGCKLAFILPDGERIVIGDSSGAAGADPAAGTRGGLAAAGAAESASSANSK